MKNAFLYLIICFIFFACAQVVAPTGGIKDTVAPVTLDISPENATTNFTSKTIEIEFDEFVKLNQLNKELIVSPPLKNKIETKLKGKKLIIELNDTLKPNTTYVMNFGNAIVDVNENNELESFQYVFSTGSVLDSLSLSGVVVDAFSLAPEKEILVMLYNETSNDSIPYLELPTYIGRVNEAGQFKITNIAEGNYKLFALLDGNDNYLFDRPTEKIGFKSTSITLVKSIDSVKIYAFEEATSKQFIKKQTAERNLLSLSFNEPLTNLSISSLDTTLSEILLAQRQTNGKDSALFWWKEIPSTKIRIEVKDSTEFTDTVSFKVDSISSKSKLKLETALSKKQHYFNPISLKFNRPLENFDTTKIKVFSSDSIPLNYSLKIDSNNHQIARLKFKIEEDSTYRISILPKGFTDIYSRTLDSLNEKITFDKASDFGILNVKVSTKINSIARFIQLTDPNGKLLKEQPLVENRTTFNHLKPGNYRLKLIVDRNGNGKWDPGKYIKNEQAEKVILYDEDINIRSNWDKDIEWILK